MISMHVRTPLLESLELSEIQGSRVFLKMEALQPSGSFKNRGIGFLCTKYANVDKATSFVSSSGGNAGLAVAYAGRLLNIAVKVVIPLSTPAFMVDKIKLEGAEVILHGKDWNEADVLARKLATEAGCFYISPFDHPLIWQGHASIIHEIKEDHIKPDAIVLAVGGGGLLCGVLQGLHEVGWNDVPVFTAETEGAASFAKSVEAGQLVTLDSINTVATSLGARTVTKKALEWTKIHKIFPQVVTDKEAVEAAVRFADQHRILVEPACGAALSLLYSKKINPQQYKNIVVIVCGGSGVSLKLLDKWKDI